AHQRVVAAKVKKAGTAMAAAADTVAAAENSAAPEAVRAANAAIAARAATAAAAAADPHAAATAGHEEVEYRFANRLRGYANGTIRDLSIRRSRASSGTSCVTLVAAISSSAGVAVKIEIAQPQADFPRERPNMCP